MKKLLLIVFSFYFISSSFGQSSGNFPHKDGIGLSVGSSIGSGFSFRYNVSDRFGVQTTFVFPLYNVFYNSRYDNFHKSIFRLGGSFYYNFSVKEKLRFFTYIGGKYVKKIKLQEESQDSTWVCVDKEINKYAVGLGLGLEFYIKPNIGLSIMGGYGIYNVDGNVKTGLSGESSILFYFK